VLQGMRYPGCSTQEFNICADVERELHLVALGLREGCGDVEHLPHSWRKGGRRGPACPRLSRAIKTFSDGIWFVPFFWCFNGGFERQRRGWSGFRVVHHTAAGQYIATLDDAGARSRMADSPHA